MNKLIEIWTRKGLPFKANMRDYDDVIHVLQQQLNEIYTAFTGDYVAGEISQVEVGREAMKYTETLSETESKESLEQDTPGDKSSPKAIRRGLFSL